jgi:hypothetical protein
MCYTRQTLLTLPENLCLPPVYGGARIEAHITVTVLYFRYLTSTQIYCKENVRFGNMADGGWNICNDHLYRPRQPCLVYSFGQGNIYIIPHVHGTNIERNNYVIHHVQGTDV